MQRLLRLRTLLVLSLLVFVLTLLSNLPASLVWRQVAPSLPAEVELQGISGSLWQGNVANMRVDGIDQGALRWDWLPVAMLKGQLALDLDWRPRNGQVYATLRLGLDTLVLEQVNGRLDARSMAAVNKAPFILTGDWLLDIPELRLEEFERVAQAQGRIVWQQAGGGLPEPLALGHLAADLSSENDWLMMTLSSDLDGPLALDGTAKWRPAQAMQLDTRLKARQQADPGLIQGLTMLGRPDADGWVHWRARLQ
ncbi:type II secretion system protein N [Pseudomonas neustonica]|uniref:type II secretion system protein N n=1 Tax=Pseudomonas TaxID=286 RepID=UPI0015F67C35|nr:type II secretion system protein N [Pseudomonas sp. 5Ae-yellow]MBA6418980.1 type II secretion system protein N [Pseudomonas sp. 5Ae-yellow]